MPEVEAIGDMATGAILARAVEPRAGETADGLTDNNNCLNCGCELAGAYCHCCGQRGHVPRTVAAWWHDFLHGVLHVDGKLWSTLGMLAWRPGELTRRYVHGERAKFISPIALFLFSVFLMFAVGSMTGGLSTGIGGPQTQREMAGEISRSEASLAELRKERDAALAAGDPTVQLDARIDDVQSELTVMRGLGNGDFVPVRASVESGELPDWLRVPIEKIARNPELTFYKLKTNAYKFSWALIPLSVAFLWLLFPFSRRFRLYDHTVFVTHSLSFMSILAVVAMLLGSAGLGSLASLLFFVPPVHMYRQLKGAYGLGGPSALARTALLVLFAMVALALFGVALFAMGLFD